MPARKLVAAAALSSLAAAAAPSFAAAAVRNGPLAFSAKRAGGRVIYERNADRTGLHRLLPQRGADQPAFSPLGRRIAFTVSGATGPSLWIADLAGDPARQVTQGFADREPAWSPAGDALVFARGRSGRRDLYRILADGSGVRRITWSRQDDLSPSWSRRGTIAFVRRGADGGDIWAISAAGEFPRRLTRSEVDDEHPAWSPSGRTLAYSRGDAGRRDLYLLSTDGARKRRLTSLPGDETEPAWSPNGRYLAFVSVRSGERRLYVMRLRSGALRRLTAASSAARSPSWQPTGLPPVVAAAGDVACDPANPAYNGGLGTPNACRQIDTSNLLFRMDLWSVLGVGDLQYEDGTLDAFRSVFAPTWGRLTRLLRPVPGNHEYRTAGAAGYFDFFNGPGAQTGRAGDRSQGWYSFDLGTWHIVAINSDCDQVGGCLSSSPELTWLRQDLAAHPANCTLAFFHYPRFSSGRHEEAGDNTLPIWQTLYDARADVIVNGHEHIYERFAPQTPAGAPDPQNGVREFISGVGGKTRFAMDGPAPNSEARYNLGFGVLQLVLREGAYDWRFVNVRGRTVDSGSTPCH